MKELSLLLQTDLDEVDIFKNDNCLVCNEEPTLVRVTESNGFDENEVLTDEYVEAEYKCTHCGAEYVISIRENKE